MKNKKELPKTWEPKKFEDLLYQNWEKSGYFNPDNLDLPENAPSYSIILPPPNITDKLHIGHSSMLAIEDLLIRFHRMNGFRTLWLPGTDHAAIATQNAVEKKLLKEKNKTRHELGKKEFLKEVWKFLKETQATILMQTKKMGASLDWSREAFTLDEKRKKAVRKMFVEMYEAGVIYRGERIVNWCPRCHSTLADDEVEHEESRGILYWLKYGPFVLATSRPETKLGDTAVAVHPDDKRYKDMVGKEYEILGVLGMFKIKVVADKAVDPNFGSGAIKVTPAHSFVDNEIAERHQLPMKKIINEDGRMMKNCGKYAGMTTMEARKAIVSDLEKMGLIDHIEENYNQNIARCYRCNSVIEPIPSKQWFIDVDKKLDRLIDKSLKEKAIEVAEEKEIEFIPERFSKRYLFWMKNLHNWCISRQIWFGHEIPVWYKGKEIYVSEVAPKEAGWTQDPDTLDTWFSSGMWTFSTLGWPASAEASAGKSKKDSSDLKNFHPTQVLETGYDILTLWVSRMIIMSLFALQEIPFKDVYLHGLVLDKNGKKMSKSKGNGIDPVEMIEKYGTDAVRLSLLIGNTPGNDIRMSEEKIEGFKKFVNKLWNVSRFVFSQIEANKTETEKNVDYTSADLWILEKFENLINEVTQDIKNYRFSQAGEKLKVFTWDDFADWYLEISKIEKKSQKKEILKTIITDLLKLWHPYLPFVTEKLWENTDSPALLLIEKWPKAETYNNILKKENSKNNLKNFSLIQKIITAVRSVRAEYNISPTKKINVTIYAGGKTEFLNENYSLIKNFRTNIGNLVIEKKGVMLEKAYYENIAGTEIYIELEKIIDFEKEKDRMIKEISQKEKLIIGIDKKLSNKKFIENAPAEIIEKEKEKLELIKNQKEKLSLFLQKLK